ncbi:MAG TPA: hypothetical protein ENH82_14280 [bacterium]|nr:hypothetical protein [bacterium]
MKASWQDFWSVHAPGFKCGICGKIFNYLMVIDTTSFKEFLCSECLERKGGDDYIEALRECEESMWQLGVTENDRAKRII